MAKKRIKTQDHEKLDDANLKRVIALLEDEKSPITKKEACRLLNITYNTSRLNRIIEDFKSKAEYAKKRREQNRGKAFSDYEVKEIVLEYLKGVSKKQIADALFRSVASVDNILDRYHIPKRASNKSGTYHHPELIPDEALSTDYSPGELVWSARYNCVAEVIKLIQEHPEHGKVYSLWIFGRHNERGCQPWYELGKMPILEQLGITKSDVSLTDRLQMEYSIG
jgi:transposase